MYSVVGDTRTGSFVDINPPKRRLMHVTLIMIVMINKKERLTTAFAGLREVTATRTPRGKPVHSLHVAEPVGYIWPNSVPHKYTVLDVLLCITDVGGN